MHCPVTFCISVKSTRNSRAKKPPFFQTFQIQPPVVSSRLRELVLAARARTAEVERKFEDLQRDNAMSLSRERRQTDALETAIARLAEDLRSLEHRLTVLKPHNRDSIPVFAKRPSASETATKSPTPIANCVPQSTAADPHSRTANQSHPYCAHLEFRTHLW
jgi:hypothetical protein